MKILHVVHGYFPAIGGAEMLVQQLSQYLANVTGDDVTVYTTFGYNTSLFTKPHAPSIQSSRREERLNGVNIRRFHVINRFGKLLNRLQGFSYRYRLPGNGSLRMLAYGPISPSMKAAIKNFAGDVIVGASFPLNHMNYLFSNRKKLPVILIGCFHTSDKHGFDNPRILKLIGMADGYSAGTPHEKEYLIGKGIDERKIRVIGVGLPTMHVREKNGQKADSSDGMFADDFPLIVFLGQHGEHKGIETLIRAMPIIWRDSPQAQLIIAGATTQYSKTVKEISAEIDTTGNKRIHFEDDVNESRKTDILRACDVFASPSCYESLGVTILEAWAQRKPVVACRLGATRHLIEEYKTGLLVEYRDERELAAAILELLDDSELRRRMGGNGYNKLVENYTFQIVGEKHRQFCNDVLQRCQ